MSHHCRRKKFYASFLMIMLVFNNLWRLMMQVVNANLQKYWLGVAMLSRCCSSSDCETALLLMWFLEPFGC